METTEDGDLTEEAEKEFLSIIFKSIIPSLIESDGAILKRLIQQYQVQKKRLGELNDQLEEFVVENDV